MKALDILSFWQRHGLTLGDEEGFRFGSPGIELTGIMVAWMATMEVIRAAHERSCNLLIVHEDLLFPPGYVREPAEKYLSAVVNSRRLQMLARRGITVFRGHASLDRLCILDDFASAIGLPTPVVKEGWLRVYEVSLSLGELAAQVKERLALPGLRVVGNLSRPVHRVGLPWGGMSLSLNASFLERLYAQGVDVLIAGEMDEYAMWASQDAGVAVIETSHTVSEEPGLRHAAQMLELEFPHLPVHFLPLGRPWGEFH